MQLTFIPGISRNGASRLLVEAVRVDRALRGQGIGRRADGPRARTRPGAGLRPGSAHVGQAAARGAPVLPEPRLRAVARGLQAPALTSGRQRSASTTRLRTVLGREACASVSCRRFLLTRRAIGRLVRRTCCKLCKVTVAIGSLLGFRTTKGSSMSRTARPRRFSSAHLPGVPRGIAAAAGLGASPSWPRSGSPRRRQPPRRRRGPPATEAADRTAALVGSLQDELGCAADWDPACAETELVAQGDGTFVAEFEVPGGHLRVQGRAGRRLGRVLRPRRRPGQRPAPSRRAGDAPRHLRRRHPPHRR